MQPPVRFEFEENQPFDYKRMYRLMGQAMRDIYRRIDDSVAGNITVVVGGGSSGGTGSSSTAEMRVGRATVGAGSVVVSFAGGNMSTTDYELVCLMKDNDGVFQVIDTHSATKSISGFTIDTFTAGTLIYVAIPRQ